MEHIILLAVPAFLLLIALELLVGWWRGRQTYTLADSISSLSLGVLSQLTGLYTKLFGIGLYTLGYQYLRLGSLPADDWRVWLFAILAYDFCYYWLHRAGHEINLLWAAHVVHHSSEHYNLSTALRQTSTGFLFSWVFYVPMAVAGVPPTVFVAAGLINLLYQYWIHTRQIGRLGWFDKVFASPSNHRVHHGQNDYCLDRNYGGLLMLWDHLFGTYVDERKDEPIVYGIRGQLGSHNPLWANLHVYRDLWRDVRLAGNGPDRLRTLLKPPGWRPPAAERQAPKSAWSLAHYVPYLPVLSPRRQGASLLVFIALFAAAAAVLGYKAQLAPPILLLLVVGISAALVLLGRAISGRAANKAATA